LSPSRTSALLVCLITPLQQTSFFTFVLASQAAFTSRTLTDKNMIFLERVEAPRQRKVSPVLQKQQDNAHRLTVASNHSRRLKTCMSRLILLQQWRSRISPKPVFLPPVVYPLIKIVSAAIQYTLNMYRFSTAFPIRRAESLFVNSSQTGTTDNSYVIVHTRPKFRRSYIFLGWHERWVRGPSSIVTFWEMQWTVNISLAPGAMKQILCTFTHSQLMVNWWNRCIIFQRWSTKAWIRGTFEMFPEFGCPSWQLLSLAPRCR